MNAPQVKVKQGILKGGFLETEFGKFLLFNGIPYAEAPVGHLRFADPKPVKPWSGIREAINEGGVSSQMYFLNMSYIGGDDCLYLNVTTKSTSGNKPVMVWIHGGGFTSGSGNSDLYRADYLVQHDIVFVSINYRLGMLGFLNMDMEDCSGNQGLKDQVLALKWVQENIEAFGGDKNNVTVFGESAGSASVHYLCISPLAKGLFHQAIAQSGVAINPWAFQSSNKEFAIKVARELGCPSSDTKEVVAFLRKMPTETILKTQSKLFDEHPFKIEFHFLPTVDSKSSNPFLPKPISEMILNGVDVPLIIGYNSDEGIIALGSPKYEESFKELNDDFDKTLSKDLNINLSTASQFSKTVREFYFGESPITKEQHDNMIQYKGDVIFVAGIWHILEKQVEKKTPTYLYKFSHSTENSLVKSLLKINIKGASHADELGHLFYATAFPEEMQLKKGTVDYLIMQRMTKMWTNFAKTGNPTPESDNLLMKVTWSPCSSTKKSCLHIDQDLKTEDNFLELCWNLWKSIYQKYKLF